MRVVAVVWLVVVVAVEIRRLVKLQQRRNDLVVIGAWKHRELMGMQAREGCGARHGVTSEGVRELGRSLFLELHVLLYSEVRLHHDRADGVAEGADYAALRI